MRVLVTGAGGFIGSHLTERLIADGHEVTAMAHYCGRDTFGWLDGVTGCERVRGDIRDADAVRSLVCGVDRVYHLAALGSVPYSFDAARSFVETNVVGTLNVAMACAEVGAELVHTSTSEVYGTALTILQDETHPLNPQSPYAASKIGADKIVEALCRSHGLRAVIMRPFNTYGPRQSVRAVIPRIIISTLAANGDALRLGSLSASRDWTYVDDTVSAFAAVEPSSACLVFNSGNGAAVTVADIVSIVREITGVHRPVREDATKLRPHRAEVTCLRADSTKLGWAVGWMPQVPLRDGIELTIAWYRARASKLVEGFV